MDLKNHDFQLKLYIKHPKPTELISLSPAFFFILDKTSRLTFFELYQNHNLLSCNSEVKSILHQAVKSKYLPTQSFIVTSVL